MSPELPPTFPNFLPLDSPQWALLGTFAAEPRRLPVILHRLIRAPIDGADPGIDEMVSAVFQQYSVEQVTYAAFPYMAIIEARYARTNPRLFYLMANIAASSHLEDLDSIAELRVAFLQALVHFEHIAVSRLLQPGRSCGDISADCESALAFARHCCGKLLMDTLTDEEGTRTGLICPACKHPAEIALFQNGAVILEPERQPKPPDPPTPWSLPRTDACAAGEPNPWQRLGVFLAAQVPLYAQSDMDRLGLEMASQLCMSGLNPYVAPTDAFTLIGAILLANGHLSAAHRLFRMSDTVKCPRCSSNFVAATAWWGCEG